MPELPEVETIRAGLNQLLPGKKIVRVDFDWPKGFPNSPADVKQFLVGATVVKVARRAKVLLIELDSKYSLVIHLKMTGQMVFRSERANFGAGHPNDSLIGRLPDKSTRVIITLGMAGMKKADGLEPSARRQRSAEEGVQEVRRLSTGAADNAIDQERWRSFGLCPKAGQCGPQLFFNDQRKFGWMKLLPTAEVPNIDFMKKVGPEPLADDFTWTVLRDRLKRRPNTSIKAAILDQTVLAGVGNIYADESLWLARIHPSTLTKNVSVAKIKALHASIQEVLRLSIKNGGSTDRNYVDANGQKGSYLKFANVFRREGQPCPRCGTIVEKVKVAGRGTHICPHCQKLVKR